MGNNTVTYVVESACAGSSCKQVQNFLWISLFSIRSCYLRKTLLYLSF